MRRYLQSTKFTYKKALSFLRVSHLRIRNMDGQFMERVRCRIGWREGEDNREVQFDEKDNQ